MQAPLGPSSQLSRRLSCAGERPGGRTGGRAGGWRPRSVARPHSSVRPSCPPLPLRKPVPLRLPPRPRPGLGTSAPARPAPSCAASPRGPACPRTRTPPSASGSCGASREGGAAAVGNAADWLMLRHPCLPASRRPRAPGRPSVLLGSSSTLLTRWCCGAPARSGARTRPGSCSSSGRAAEMGWAGSA